MILSFLDSFLKSCLLVFRGKYTTLKFNFSGSNGNVKKAEARRLFLIMVKFIRSYANSNFRAVFCH